MSEAPAKVFILQARMNIRLIAKQLGMVMRHPADGIETTLIRRVIPQLETGNQAVFAFLASRRDPEAFAVIAYYPQEQADGSTLWKYGIEISKSGMNELHIFYKDTEVGVIAESILVGVNPGRLAIDVEP